MAEEPKPEFNHHFTPAQLKTNHVFQDSWVVCKPHLQNMLQHLQRKKAVEYKDDKEEAGRQILIINDFFELLDDCTGSETAGQNQRQKRKPLHNK